MKRDPERYVELPIACSGTTHTIGICVDSGRLWFKNHSMSELRAYIILGAMSNNRQNSCGCARFLTSWRNRDWQFIKRNVGKYSDIRKFLHRFKEHNRINRRLRKNVQTPVCNIKWNRGFVENFVTVLEAYGVIVELTWLKKNRFALSIQFRNAAGRPLTKHDVSIDGECRDCHKSIDVIIRDGTVYHQLTMYYAKSYYLLALNVAKAVCMERLAMKRKYNKNK